MLKNGNKMTPSFSSAEKTIKVIIIISQTYQVFLSISAQSKCKRFSMDSVSWSLCGYWDAVWYNAKSIMLFILSSE